MLTQISVFLENKEGKLAKIVRILEEANVNIRAISLADNADFGMARLITDDPEKARRALADKGCLISLTDVVGVTVPDVVGGLSGLLSLLADRDIPVEYMYSYLTGLSGGANMVLRVQDAAAVEMFLIGAGYTIV